MDFHFITTVIGFRESNMQTLVELRKIFLGVINCQILLSERILTKLISLRLFVLI